MIFPRFLHHAELPSRVFHDPESADKALAEGWQLLPVRTPAPPPAPEAPASTEVFELNKKPIEQAAEFEYRSKMGKRQFELAQARIAELEETQHKAEAASQARIAELEAQVAELSKKKNGKAKPAAEAE